MQCFILPLYTQEARTDNIVLCIASTTFNVHWRTAGCIIVWEVKRWRRLNELNDAHYYNTDKMPQVTVDDAGYEEREQVMSKTAQGLILMVLGCMFVIPGALLIGYGAHLINKSLEDSGEHTINVAIILGPVLLLAGLALLVAGLLMCSSLNCRRREDERPIFSVDANINNLSETNDASGESVTVRVPIELECPNDLALFESRMVLRMQQPQSWSPVPLLFLHATMNTVYFVLWGTSSSTGGKLTDSVQFHSLTHVVIWAVIKIQSGMLLQFLAVKLKLVKCIFIF